MATDFEVKKDNRGQWYWTLQANNNETIARSSESYIAQRDCLHSVKLVKDLALRAPDYNMEGVVTRVDDLP